MKDTVTRLSYAPHLALINRMLAPLREVSSIGGLTALAIARSACRAEGRAAPQAEGELAALLGEDFATAVHLTTQWPLSAMGQLQWRAVLVTAARMRLQLDAYLAAGRPLGELGRPLFIVGLPRTGTTLLQNLLATAPRRAALKFWQLLRPIPRPERRFDRARRELNGAFASWLYRFAAPEYPKLHLTTANTFEECWYLFMPSYSVLNADFPMPSPDYGDWLLARDMRAPYERYRQLLQILQLEVGARALVLKCPDHLWFLDALLDVFPQADVIWTHRDPAKAVPSYAAQMALSARQYMGQAEPERLGARVLLRFRQGIERASAARLARPGARVVDVQHADLAADPVGTVLAALRSLGHDPDPEHERAMHRFVRESAAARPVHRYRPETYGLTASDIRTELATYVREYRIPLEPSA